MAVSTIRPDDPHTQRLPAIDEYAAWPAIQPAQPPTVGRTATALRLSLVTLLVGAILAVLAGIGLTLLTGALLLLQLLLS